MSFLFGITVCFLIVVAATKTLPALPSPFYPPNKNSITTGYVPFIHPLIPLSLNVSTWYRTVTPFSSIKDTRPLVILHGGPGISHLYLRPTFDLFAQKTGRKVIYYDQFGGGNSTRYPASKGNTTLWTAELFMDELDNVLAHVLDEGEKFDIYGHSWGAMFGALYASTRPPPTLKKLILGSGPAVMHDWSVAARNLLHDLHLGDDIEAQAFDADARGDYNNQTYQDAMTTYNQNYLCRLATWPNELLEVLSDPDDTVHATMVGGSDFNITGSLRTWDVSNEAKNIKIPTMVLRGQFDEAQQNVVEPWMKNIAGAVEHIIRGGSHTAHLEFPWEYVEAVENFLRH